MENKKDDEIIDYLDEDENIRNQNFVCLSFLNPEDNIIKNKELFYFTHFINKFAEDLNMLFDNLSLKYTDQTDLLESIKKNHNYIFDNNELNEQFNFFKNTNSTDIEDKYYKNTSKNTIRGIKVRGVYDTMEQAKQRIENLKKKDKYHNIYVAQVGCWLPYESHITNTIEEQEYSETQLNSLMKNYKDNKDQKDIIFDNRTSIKSKNIIKKDEENIQDNIHELNDPWLDSKEQK